MKAENFFRVLIVDDELLIRQGVKHYINWEQEGFLVIGEASNGKEALELIEELQPHIVITDIVMPVMDGEELTRIVKDKYPEIEIIILSSYGEFNYVRSAFQYGVVDYVLKPKIESGELLKVLKKATKRITITAAEKTHIDDKLMIDSMIEKLISGYGIDDREKINQVFQYNFYYVLGLDMKYHNYSKKKEAISKEVKRKLKEFLKLEDIQSYIHDYEYDANLLLWIINSDKTDVEHVLERIAHLVQERMKLKFVLSKMFRNFHDLAAVCKEEVQVLVNKQFFLPNHHLLMEANLPDEKPIESKFQFELFAKNIKQRQFEEAFRYLLSHAVSLSSQYSLNPFEYKVFLSNSIFNITIEMNKIGCKMPKLEEEKYLYLQKADQIKSAGEGVELLKEFVAKVQGELADRVNQNESINIKMIIDYINDNYNEPISLKSIGEHFHFSPSYLSNYFSTHNKEGFTEYLNKIRIEKAAIFLQDDQKTISEIGSMVGYSDHSYFCRVFKRITGMSPSHYRRNIYQESRECWQ